MFKKLFPVILTDNGTEFSNPSAIEFDKNGERRTRIFYCDAGASWQKGACEVNHEMIRRIIPKGTDIGRYTQEMISLAMNHINSYARANLANKTPYEMFAFMYGEDILALLGVEKINADEIVLTKALFKRKDDGNSSDNA